MSKLPSGKLKFTFVVIADTHMNQSEDYSSSPYPCNVLANARTRRVIAEINNIDPVLVVHLGDIVNPVPELPTYADAAGHFKRLVGNLRAPIHLVPGNHDVGDKPVSWAAGVVSPENLALYQSHFGKDYFSFDQAGIHFVVINASIINSGLAQESAQSQWLESDLASSVDRRTFLFIHYPPYVSNADEPGSYDNIDEPGRGWLLDLLRRFEPEAMFCGHVHNFWYDVHAETEIYILPSTAFVRHDYSEFFRVGPADQYGRNDDPKLGYFVVRVYEHGHVAENIRTYGRTLKEDACFEVIERALPAIHSKEQSLGGVALDLRHPWAEEIEIPPSGALDEFERKWARNDYPLLALWEMGVRHLRIPIQDVLDDRVARRMQLLKNLGHSFHVYFYGDLSDARLGLLGERAHLVDRLEVVCDWERIEESLQLIESIKRHRDIPVFLSRVNRRNQAKHSDGRYNHLISHGFTTSEKTDLAEVNKRRPGCLQGFVLKVLREASPWEAAAEAQTLADELETRIVLYVKSTSSSPAAVFEDDVANARRVAEAVLGAVSNPRVDVVLDTFVDADRGYFTRHGLVDRRYNPRLGSRVVSSLGALLNQNTGWIPAEGEGGKGSVAVETPAGGRIELLTGDSEPRSSADARLIDLGSGLVVKTPSRCAGRVIALVQ